MSANVIFTICMASDPKRLEVDLSDSTFMYHIHSTHYSAIHTLHTHTHKLEHTHAFFILKLIYSLCMSVSFQTSTWNIVPTRGLYPDLKTITSPMKPIVISVATNNWQPVSIYSIYIIYTHYIFIFIQLCPYFITYDVQFKAFIYWIHYHFSRFPTQRHITEHTTEEKFITPKCMGEFFICWFDNSGHHIGRW